MVGGDSVGWSLVYPWVAEGGEPPAHLDLRLVADLGCTITPGVVLVDGVEQLADACRNWREVWSATAFDQQPDVVVAVWGAWEVFDHRDGATLLQAGTPAFARRGRRRGGARRRRALHARVRAHRVGLRRTAHTALARRARHGRGRLTAQVGGLGATSGLPSTVGQNHA